MRTVIAGITAGCKGGHAGDGERCLVKYLTALREKNNYWPGTLFGIGFRL
jgi:hypothetical protein